MVAWVNPRSASKRSAVRIPPLCVFFLVSIFGLNRIFSGGINAVKRNDPNRATSSGGINAVKSNDPYRMSGSVELDESEDGDDRSRYQKTDSKKWSYKAKQASKNIYVNLCVTKKNNK